MRTQAFWGDILKRLPNFAVVEANDGVEVRGVEALKFYMRRARERHESKSLQMADLDWPQRLRYMLSASEQTELGDFVKGCLSRLGASSESAAAASAAASSSRAQPAGKKKKASACEDLSKSAMLALFD
jgi:ribosomal protein L12E/L44/L45/RPP1/RPP2